MTQGPQKQCSRVSDLQIHKYKYTNTQIHKYANTALVKVTDIHDMCYIFEKVMVRGPQKQCSRVSDLQIHKYTKTQIQHWSKLQIDMTCAIFFEKVMVRGPQKQCFWVSDLQKHKYKYTNTQIHKYTNTQIQHWSKLQIDMTCAIFLKRLW